MKRTLLAVLLSGAVASAGAAAKENDFGDFISPSSSPTVFEDPRPTTEARPIYFYQRLGEDFGENAGIDGGDLHVLVVQLRLKLSERFGLVLNKSGYVWFRPDVEVFDTLETDDGWANLGFGVKYAAYRDPARNAMLTFGLRYESSSGDKDVFQGRGQGALNPSLAGLWGVGGFHAMAYTGPRIPISGDDSTFWDTALHFDYKLTSFYPVGEFAWTHVLDDGRRIPFRDEGNELFDIGSSRASGKGVVTAGVGFRWRPLEAFGADDSPFANSDIGFTYQVPLTSDRGFLGWRLISDVTLRFH
jgi:hypothetical protein